MKQIFGICIFLLSYFTCLAQFDVHVKRISALAIDNSGNIYLGAYAAGYWPAGIYKIDTKGNLLLIANGKLDYHHRELNLSNADFNNPTSLVLDSHNNLFVCDISKNIIKKITSGGAISIFAGNGKGNLKDGPGRMAEFYRMGGMTIDDADNIYIIDQDGKVIRKITPEGMVSTYLAPTLSILHIKDLAIDSKGNFFVTDLGGGTIKKIDPQGKISVFAGSQSNGHIDGQGKAAKFKFPDQICIDSEDNLYVTDDHSIRKISPEAMVTTVAGKVFTDREISDIESDTKSMGMTFDRDGNAKKIYLPLSIQDITCDKNDIIYFTVEHERYLRMLRNGQVYTMGRRSTSFVARNIPETKEKFEPELPVVKVKPNEKDIERIVDSIMKKNISSFPQMGAAGFSVPQKPDTNDNRNIPLRNQRKLDLASRKLNTTAEVIAYINELESKISVGLKGTKVTMYDNADKNASAAYGYWMGGKPRESLLCAIQSAKQESELDYILNNTATLLGLCGMEYMGVPLLIVCLKNEPENSTINNNLGQAYLMMGDQKTAEDYFKKCIRVNPYHPHANSSLGFMAEKKGNRAAAAEYYKNSIKGSFTISAVNGLLRINPLEELKLMDLIRHRYKTPNYINFDSFPIPHQSLNTLDQPQRKVEYDNYLAVLHQQSTKFSKLIQQQKPLARAAQERQIKSVKNKQNIMQPFQPLAYYIIASLNNEYSKKLINYGNQMGSLNREYFKLVSEYYRELEGVDIEFRERMDAVGEGNPDPELDGEICEKKNLITNGYLQQFGTINEILFSGRINIDRQYLNDILFWKRFVYFSNEEYELDFLETMNTYIWVMSQLRLNYFPADDCQAIHKAYFANKNYGFRSTMPPCPLMYDIEIPFLVGKVNLGCGGWGLEMGEGLILNIDHVAGGETTFALGLGLSYDFLGKEKAKSHSTPEIGIKSFIPIPGIDVGAKQQFFMTVNNGALIDGGILYEAEMDIKGIGKPFEAKQTYVFAVNKGFTDEGLLSDLGNKIFDIPEAPQINKKVKKYIPKPAPKVVPK